MPYLKWLELGTDSERQRPIDPATMNCSRWSTLSGGSRSLKVRLTRDGQAAQLLGGLKCASVAGCRAETGGVGSLRAVEDVDSRRMGEEDLSRVECRGAVLAEVLWAVGREGGAHETADSLQDSR